MLYFIKYADLRIQECHKDSALSAQYIYHFQKQADRRREAMKADVRQRPSAVHTGRALNRKYALPHAGMK